MSKLVRYNACSWTRDIVGVFHQASLDRIIVDVTGTNHKLHFIFNDDTGVAVVEKGSRPAVESVIEVNIADSDSFHGCIQRLAAGFQK